MLADAVGTVFFSCGDGGKKMVLKTLKVLDFFPLKEVELFS